MNGITADLIQSGDVRALAKAISLVENQAIASHDLLRNLSTKNIPMIGITGPPGAGKSTLTDALLRLWITEGKRMAVLCVDPSSPFHRGALLGDRIRMQEWYNHPDVYIRSLASRGSLGGLHPRIIEITTLLSAAPFDMILIETVGVGQTEIEIARLANITLVVTVPEAGDEIQAMKSGLMEIADIFVVNKSDRPDADRFVHHLKQHFRDADQSKKILQTVATTQKGVKELGEAIEQTLQSHRSKEAQVQLLTHRAFEMIAMKRMKDVSQEEMKKEISDLLAKETFNLFSYIDDFENKRSTAINR